MGVCDSVSKDTKVEVNKDIAKIAITMLIKFLTIELKLKLNLLFILIIIIAIDTINPINVAIIEPKYGFNPRLFNSKIIGTSSKAFNTSPTIVLIYTIL